MPLIWFRLVAGGVAVLLVIVIVIVIVRGGAVGGKATPGPVKTWISPVDGMVMVYVPEGTFWMGSSALDLVARDEKPRHEVYLDAFWLDRTEVTNAMFARFVADTGYESDAEKYGSASVHEVYQSISDPFSVVRNQAGADWQHPYGPYTSLAGLDEHPVVHVSWMDAAAYCAWAGKRLPTEAEWEKAARGGDKRTFPWGGGIDCEHANYWGRDVRCAGDTTEVGRYRNDASPYGALDMAGNVSEWVADWYSEGYYANSPERNPQGPNSGERRILRGGSWETDRKSTRTAHRFRSGPSYFSNVTGFRCVRSGSAP